MVAYTNLEYQFTAIIAVILQLHKPEARLALQNPPVFESLDVVQDLLALKGLHPNFDFVKFRDELIQLNSDRNNLAHGVWLQHPETKAIYLRLTRGKWKKQQAHDPVVRRIVFPQSIPITVTELRKITAAMRAAIKQARVLGTEVDRLRNESPEKFRARGPLIDPLARRRPAKS